MTRKMYFLSGQKKITLKADDLTEIISQAQFKGLPVSIEEQDGVPVIAAIGPASNSTIDKVTGSLKLYSWNKFHCLLLSEFNCKPSLNRSSWINMDTEEFDTCIFCEPFRFSDVFICFKVIRIDGSNGWDVW